MIDLGKVMPGSTIRIPFGSYAAATGASSATTNYAAADVQIYKDGGTTQRASASGITATADFDSLTGINLVSIDLADNTTAGFYAAGSEYLVVVSDVTIDSQTVRFPIGRFIIGVDRAVLNTTIATLASQTSFTLTAGPAEDNALVGCTAYIHDVASAVQGSFVYISAYTGSTKTVTLSAGATFTAAATDNICIFAPAQVYGIAGTAQTARDIGASVLLSSGTGTGQLDFTSGVVKANTTQFGGAAGTFASGRPEVNTSHIAGSAVSTDSAQLGVNVVQISGDGTAADNLEAACDGNTYNVGGGAIVAASVTGAVGSVTGAVGSVTGNVGGSVASVTGAVGSVTGNVGGNVTGSVGSVASGGITAASIATDAIDADAVAADAVTEINTAVLAAISGIGTAGGAAINVDATTDNVLSGISGVTSGTTFAGTQSSGTFASTSNVNSVFHVITGTAAGNTAMDIVYQFLTGSGTSVVQATWVGYVTNTGDTITVSCWRHDTGAWETMTTIAGTANSTTIQTKNITLYARHRGTSTAELGKVYIRLHCTGMTTPVVGTDQLVVSYAVSSRGTYSDGAVWLNTAASNTNTQSYVDGLPENPVSTIAAAITVATNLNLRRYRIANGSSVTLAADHVNRTMIGHGYTLALGTQNVSGSYFEGVEGLSGTGTCPTAEAIFVDCHLNAVTIGEADFIRCHLMNTVTLSQASVPYRFHDCTGITSAKVTFAAASQSAVISRVSGVLTIAGMVSTNTLYIDGDADVTFDNTNNTGTVYIAGNIRLTNNGVTMSITDTARWSEDQAIASVTGAVGSVTGNVGGNVVGSVGSLAIQAKADVNAEVDTALTDIHLDHLLAADYDPASKPGTATALLNELVENDGGVSRFTANALEQGPSGGGGVADWTSDERTAIRAILGIPGSGTTPEDPSSGILDTIRDYIDTEVGAIKAKTDNLPASPAATGDIPSAANIADAVWDEARSGHTTGGSFGEGVASVQGNVTGSVASVTGAVGSVTGNVGGNVTGSVGSVAGAVGSVTGNVGGNVVGSVGSLAIQAKADVNAEVDAALAEYDPPTNAELEARTLVAANYFDPASDGVNVTKVNGITIDGSGTELDPWGPA